MTQLDSLFATKLYVSALDNRLLLDIDHACRHLALDDRAGQAWCEEHDYPGYTSYASLNDLPWRFPIFKKLSKALDKHVAAFAKMVAFELGDKPLKLDSLWVNVLDPGGFHGAHIHPHSVVSGTLYVAVPLGASAIRFEDPRLPAMMAAPPRLHNADPDLKSFVSHQPQPGTLLLWESWLRHDVPLNGALSERISVSFNYRWG